MKILQLFSYKTLLFLVDTRTSSRETQTKENSKEIPSDRIWSRRFWCPLKIKESYMKIIAVFSS
jgi:hypothetical protein